MYYYGKFDECSQDKFQKIVKEFRLNIYDIYTTNPCYPFDIVSTISPKFIYEYLEKDISELKVESTKDAYIKSTAQELIKRSKKSLMKNTVYYEQAELPPSFDRRNLSLSGFRKSATCRFFESKQFSNIYYGKYGIVTQIFLVKILKRSKFREVSSIRTSVNQKLESDSTSYPDR